MLQKFNKTTIIAKYIKYLLQQTALPLYPYIFDGQKMVAGMTYTYKNRLYKCTSSGMFVSSNYTGTYEGFLTASSLWTVSDTQQMQIYNPATTTWSDPQPFTVTDEWIKMKTSEEKAKYTEVGRFIDGQFKPGVTQQFFSNVGYYDFETHYRLGEYLRYLNNRYDLNLLGLYNWFSGETVSHLSITEDMTFQDEPIDNYLVYIVPIKFNQVYTIAYDCLQPSYLGATFFNGTLVKDYEDNNNLLSDKLSNNVIRNSASQYSTSFTFSVQCYDLKLLDFEKYLKLVIQVPLSNNFSATVLEGDFTQVDAQTVINAEELDRFSDEKQSMIETSSLSLLHNTSDEIIPFSDKLIAYLLRYTIDTREYIDENIAKVQKEIDYKAQYLGQWSRDLKHTLYTRYMNSEKIRTSDKYDILGYVDKNIEQAVERGYM